MFEDILVDAYGSSQPMKNVAQITIPDSKTVSIKPFDKSVLKAVETDSCCKFKFKPNTFGFIIINIPRLLRKEEI